MAGCLHNPAFARAARPVCHVSTFNASSVAAESRRRTCPKTPVCGTLEVRRAAHCEPMQPVEGIGAGLRVHLGCCVIVLQPLASPDSCGALAASASTTATSFPTGGGRVSVPFAVVLPRRLPPIDSARLPPVLVRRTAGVPWACRRGLGASLPSSSHERPHSVPPWPARLVPNIRTTRLGCP